MELRNGGDLLVRDLIAGGDVEVLPGDSLLPASFAFAELTIRGGARVGVAEGSTLRGFVDGTLTIETAAALDLSGRGYPGSGASGSANGGAPAGVAPSTPDAGGSHGGLGTRWNQGTPGEIYDSVFLPRLPGGGGARDEDGVADGLPGGGAIELTVGDLVLDGEILARGSGGVSNGAGGAGGSVLLTAARLSGTDLVDVSGGSTAPCCTTQRTGSGGGGRVALYVDLLDGFDPLVQVVARGGERRDTDGTVVEHAGAGTVFVETPTSLFGELLVDQGSHAGTPVARTVLPRLGTGRLGTVHRDAGDPTALWIEALEGPLPPELAVGGGSEALASGPLDLDALFDLGASGAYLRVAGVDYRVIAQSAGRRRLLLAGAAGVVGAGDPYQGVYKLDRVIVRGCAILVFEDQPEVGSFDVDFDSEVVDDSP